jgi:hypothetical protein
MAQAQSAANRVTLDLLRKRAEHNGGMVATLQVRPVPVLSPAAAWR